MPGHPFLERLDAALVGAVPSMSIAVHGEWASRTRRSSQGEVVDHIWDARLTSVSEFTGMAFVRTESGVHWAKSARVSRQFSAGVSLHAYAHSGVEEAQKTFGARLDDVCLPGVPVVPKFGDPSECLVDTAVVPAGRVVCLARCGGNAFFVVLFAADTVKFGRNRLWRVRDSIASQLPADIGEVLTRRRAGVLRPGSAA